MLRPHLLIERIAALHGLPAQPVEEIVGGGSVNRVVVVGIHPHRWVVRTALDQRRADEFAVERWCSDQARRAGVPTPEIIAAGSVDGVPYGVQRFVPGARGDQEPTPGRGPETAPRIDSAATDQLWTVLGRYGRRIADIAITADAPDGLFGRFGRDLPAAWAAHLRYNLAMLDGRDPLLSSGVLTPEHQRRLRAQIEELARRPMAFGLSHGDLSPRNLIVPAYGEPELIDWGSAACGPVPWNDLVGLEHSRRLTGAPTAEQIEAFARGWGIEPDAPYAADLERLVQLGAVDLVRWAFDQRPDLLDSYVARLQTVLGAPSGCPEPPARRGLSPESAG